MVLPVGGVKSIQKFKKKVNNFIIIKSFLITKISSLSIFKMLFLSKIKKGLPEGTGPPSTHNNLKFQCPFRRGVGVYYAVLINNHDLFLFKVKSRKSSKSSKLKK